jgi:hypothetical protein
MKIIFPLMLYVDYTDRNKVISKKMKTGENQKVISGGPRSEIVAR